MGYIPKSAAANRSIPVGLAVGAVVSVGLTLAGAALLSKLIDREVIAESAIGYGVMILLMVASYLGSTMAYRSVRQQRLVVSMLSAAFYIGLLIAITILFFEGEFAGVWPAVLVILGGAGLTALPKNESRRAGKGRKIRIGHR